MMRRTEPAPNNAAGPARLLSLSADERGSGLVEYAIVFTIFMTMLLGVADFGRALYAYHFVSSAARDATRYAAVRGSTCGGDGSCAATNSASGNAGPASVTDIQDFVNKVPLGIDTSHTSQLTTTPTWPGTGVTGAPAICNTTTNAPGCTVKVQVSYNFYFVVPFVSKLVNSGNGLHFQSASEMVISH